MSKKASVQQVWSARSVFLLCVALVLGISYTLATGVWQLMGHREEPAINPVQSIVRGPAEQKTTQVNAREIARWNIFGDRKAVAKPEPKPVQPTQDIEAPETRLQLTLFGVFIADDPAQSTALIAQQRAKAEVYKVADKVGGQATLEAVHPDRVLLRTRGRVEALYFPSYQKGGQRASNNAKNKGAINVTKQKLTNNKKKKKSTRKMPGIPDDIAQMIMTGQGSPQEVMAKLSQSADFDAEAAMKGLGLRVNPNGPGYKLGKGMAGDLFSMVGGRTGDTVLSINNQSLTGDPMSDMVAIETMLSSPGVEAVDVELERNGKVFSSSLPLP